MAAYGLTLGTMLLYLGVTVFEFAGGIALAISQTTHEAVFLLVLFMVMVTGIFTKNVAIIGGLAYVLAYGAGPLSLDARRRPDR